MTSTTVRAAEWSRVPGLLRIIIVSAVLALSLVLLSVLLVNAARRTREA